MTKLIKWLNPPRYRFISNKVSEGCQSGRMSTLGKRVYLAVSWVRIPFPPPYIFCYQKLRTQDNEYPLRSIATPSIWLVEAVEI